MSHFDGTVEDIEHLNPNPTAGCLAMGIALAIGGILVAIVMFATIALWSVG